MRFQHLRVGRKKRAVERAFAEDGPEMIGDAKRDEERVRDGPGAHHRRQDDVTDKAGEP